VVMLIPYGNSGIVYSIRIYRGHCRHLEDRLHGRVVGSRDEVYEVVINSFL
jgi:hypothetical protein